MYILVYLFCSNIHFVIIWVKHIIKSSFILSLLFQFTLAKKQYFVYKIQFISCDKLREFNDRSNKQLMDLLFVIDAFLEFSSMIQSSYVI